MRENDGYKALLGCNRISIEIEVKEDKKFVIIENQVCIENQAFIEDKNMSPIEWKVVKGGLFKMNEIAEMAEFIDKIEVEKNIFSKTRTVEEIELKNALNLLIKYVI